MLLSDGSVTRHLQLLSNLTISVDCLEMARLPDPAPASLPGAARRVPGPLLQRQVLLRRDCGERQPLVYATSWWNADEAPRYLPDAAQPIWSNLTRDGLELYRDVRRIYLGESRLLAGMLGAEGPFWARHYLFWHDGRPLTCVFEVFSTALQDYLGSADGCDGGACAAGGPGGWEGGCEGGSRAGGPGG